MYSSVYTIQCLPRYGCRQKKYGQCQKKILKTKRTILRTTVIPDIFCQRNILADYLLSNLYARLLSFEKKWTVPQILSSIIFFKSMSTSEQDRNNLSKSRWTYYDFGQVWFSFEKQRRRKQKKQLKGRVRRVSWKL